MQLVIALTQTVGDKVTSRVTLRRSHIESSSDRALGVAGAPVKPVKRGQSAYSEASPTHPGLFRAAPPSGAATSSSSCDCCCCCQD